MNNPYAVIKHRYITEKSSVLESLHTSEANRCVSRCQSPKYVFLVDNKANKKMIAEAVEMIYRERKVKVTKVNTLYIQPKMKRKGKGRRGFTPRFKKAVVTMESGDSLD